MLNGHVLELSFTEILQTKNCGENKTSKEKRTVPLLSCRQAETATEVSSGDPTGRL